MLDDSKLILGRAGLIIRTFPVKIWFLGCQKGSRVLILQGHDKSLKIDDVKWSFNAFAGDSR